MADQQRILLVEDCTQGMSRTFSQFAFARNPAVRMNLAANLYDAGNRLRNGGFSLVLLALRLPDCQGIETLRRFKEIGVDAPFAILLQDDEWHLEKEVKMLGAVGVFSPGRVPVEEALRLCGAPSSPFNAASAAEVAVTMLPDQPETTEKTESAAPSIMESVAEAEIVPATAETVENSGEEVALESLADIENTDTPIAVEITPENAHIAPYAIGSFVGSDAAAVEVAKVDPTPVPILPPVENVVAEPTVNTGETANVAVVIVEDDGKIIDQVSAIETSVKIKPAVVTEINPEEPVAKPVDASEPMAAIAIPPAAPAIEPEKGEREEMIKLRKELCHHRAVRQELTGVNRALEERCRELEAGQAALIEAEHVAIEREKAARESAEYRAEQVLVEKEKEISVYRRRMSEFEEQCQQLQSRLNTLGQTIANNDRACEEITHEITARLTAAHQTEIAAKEKELGVYKQRADLFEKQFHTVEQQLAQAVQASVVAPAPEPQLSAQYEQLKARFEKLERSYHEQSAEKKNAEKKILALADENLTLLNRVNDLSLINEQTFISGGGQ